MIGLFALLCSARLSLPLRRTFSSNGRSSAIALDQKRFDACGRHEFETRQAADASGASSGMRAVRE